MIACFEGTRLCPITGQQLAHMCWNMQHADELGTVSTECYNNCCRCWCHTGGPREEPRQPSTEALDSST